MGKVRIGELRGHPIIVGDMNLKNKHEIHISQLLKGGNSGGSDEEVPGLPENWEIATEEDIDKILEDIFNTNI